MKYYLKLLSFPLLFLIAFLSSNLIWRFFDLPPVDELTVIIGGWFDTFGLSIVLICSLLEGLLLIGNYFPGVFIIFIGVLSARSPMEATLVVAVGTIGLFIAHVLNYFLGRYGWHKLLIKLGMQNAILKSKERLESRGPLAIPLSYWSTSLGALTNTAAGIIHMPLRKFLLYSALSSIFWYTVIGLIVYHMGDTALKFVGGGGGIIYGPVVIGLWICGLLFFDYRKRHGDSGFRVLH